MKEILKCNICGLGWKCHGYQRESLMYYHWEKRHPKTLAKIVKAKKEYYKILKKYGWIMLDRIL